MTGRARIESYAATCAKGVPAAGFVIARAEADGVRCMARVGPGDAASLASLFEEDVIGRSIQVSRVDDMHEFRVTN